MISVLILTKNEEHNIQGCLESVAWCDDVLVVDSFSTDRTLELIGQTKARVVQRAFKNFADQRNYGIHEGGFRHDWILHLDADERVTPDLLAEMRAAIQGGTKGAYRLASKMMFHGRWLKHSGMYPWHQTRLGRKDKLTFVQTGHGQRETLPAEEIGTLEQPLIHYSFSKGLHDWLERHNRYSTAEAEHALGQTPAAHSWLDILTLDGVKRRRALKAVFARLPCRPTLRFFYMYFLRRGFLDGRAGFTYCRLLSIYEYFIVLKTREAERLRRGLPI